MTTTWWEIAAVVSAVQVSQAWALRPMHPLTIAHLMAGPSVMITVMLAVLWVTGVSLPWIGVSAATGCAIQMAGARLRRRSAREEGRTDDA